MYLFRPLFLMSMLAFASTAFADEASTRAEIEALDNSTNYQVEIIVFRQPGDLINSGIKVSDAWKKDAAALTQNQERSTALNADAKKLTTHGYTVLLHKAWAQTITGSPTKTAITTGKKVLSHYPVEGALTLTKTDRKLKLDSNLWIYQFNSNGLISNSQNLVSTDLIQMNKLTFIDHQSLGILIKIRRI